VDTRAFHPNAGSNRVDAVVIRIYGYFRFFAGMRTTFFTIINPSNTSGISCSNNFSRNF
jgi:hypothetical protein